MNIDRGFIQMTLWQTGNILMFWSSEFNNLSDLMSIII